MPLVKIRATMAALASSAALIGGTVVLAAPQQLNSPAGCYSVYRWCDEISVTGEAARMKVYWGNDGHEYVDSSFCTTHQGQDLWILTWNGTGWDWFGTPATIDVGSGRWAAVDFGRSDAGQTIKIAIHDWDAGRYIYTDAH
ncbi:hypothetical protein [Kitasatospora purpeofusca]|uniref:hypothetical protein n=1 Tax=Kitasatospora purpeofusca TaxID=67352 RepID=UPI00365701C6